MQDATKVLAGLGVLAVCLALAIRFGVNTPHREEDPVAMPTHWCVRVNQGLVSSLDLLPRVGPVLARRIVAFREQHGAITKIGELDLVVGLGTDTIDKMHRWISFQQQSPQARTESRIETSRKRD